MCLNTFYVENNRFPWEQAATIPRWHIKILTWTPNLHRWCLMGTCIRGSPNRLPCCPLCPLSAGSLAWMQSSLCLAVFYLAKAWECHPKLKGLRTTYRTISSTGHRAHLSHVTSLSFASTITVTAGWTLLCSRVSDPWYSCLINNLSSPAPCIPSPSAFVLLFVMKVWELRCPRYGRSFRIFNFSAAPVILHSLQEFCKPLKHVPVLVQKATRLLSVSWSDSSDVGKHTRERVGEGGVARLDGKTGLEVTEELWMMAGWQLFSLCGFLFSQGCFRCCPLFFSTITQIENCRI